MAECVMPCLWDIGHQCSNATFQKEKGSDPSGRFPLFTQPLGCLGWVEVSDGVPRKEYVLELKRVPLVSLERTQRGWPNGKLPQQSKLKSV